MESPGSDICPRCSVTFRSRPAVLRVGQAKGFSNTPQIPPEVACPRCGQVFESKGLRYFGLIGPNAMRAGIVMGIGLMALIALLSAIR